MKKRFVMGFMIYSYVSLLSYVASENFLNLAKAHAGKGEGKKLKFQSLWKTTLKRFKEGFKLFMKED